MHPHPSVQHHLSFHHARVHGHGHGLGAECNRGGQLQEVRQGLSRGNQWRGSHPSAAFCTSSQCWVIPAIKGSTYEPPDEAESPINTSTLSFTATLRRPANDAFAPPTIFTTNIRPSAGWPLNFVTAACASLSFLKTSRTITEFLPPRSLRSVMGPHRLKIA